MDLTYVDTGVWLALLGRAPGHAFSLDKTLSRNAKKAGLRLVKPCALHLS